MPPKKAGKKGQKKKVQDAFAKKEWFELKAPKMFRNSKIGRTPVNRTAGNKTASEGLKGRVVTVNLAELNENESSSHTNIQLKVEEVQGRHCLTNFYGLAYTTDKLKSLVRKWQTLIEASIDIKTTDGYSLRIFCIGFTDRKRNQISKASYAQTSQVRQIRTKMTAVINKESNCELQDLVKKFILGSIGKSINKQCQNIFPLRDVGIRKVKLLKAPRYDPVKLLELHGEGSAAGKKLKH